MQLSHAAAAVDVVFDDPNLIADAGLVPVLALAEQIGLAELRVLTSMTNRTYSRRRLIVSTWKKSVASSPDS